MFLRTSFSQHQISLLAVFVCLVLQASCLIPIPMTQVVANCEIHGVIRMEDSNLPVENVMVFAKYEFAKDLGTPREPICIGPFFSDTNGRFNIPKFYKKQWYLEHLYMGNCGGSLLFIHPSLGAYSVLICTENFPPELPFKELEVTQHSITPKFTKEMVIFTYNAIGELPKSVQQKAWAHVVPEVRQRRGEVL